jgi:hypothetical protein
MVVTGGKFGSKAQSYSLRPEFPILLYYMNIHEMESLLVDGGNDSDVSHVPQDSETG